jgi:penicillin V acylase-like amidase (Ntn superfamily)
LSALSISRPLRPTPLWRRKTNRRGSLSLNFRIGFSPSLVRLTSSVRLFNRALSPSRQQWNLVGAATPPPFHDAVYDKTGASIVIEPINGKLVVHDNPLGTVTNTPNFDWHMTNLRNYMTAKPNNVDQSKIGKIELRALSAGNGMWGISGDLNPTSRFVRAALFSAKTVPSANAEEGINPIFHLLNNLDIPKGIARDNNTKPHHS